jgi:rfaE bifunctional protein kinase chain/domain
MTSIHHEHDRLRKLVLSFPNVTVVVLGDLVADEFLYGEISRVSREAPVLILKHRERKVLPGGGGNAVMNLAALGVNVMPVGLVGDDEPGRLLLDAFKRSKIPVIGITKVKGLATTTKTRILAYMPHSARQQVVRIDREPEPLRENHYAMARLVDSAIHFEEAADGLLISDYGYGAATPKLYASIRGAYARVPVTLDSRYRMLDYRRVTAATPNENEVEEALKIKVGSDRAKLAAAGRQLMEAMKMESLVITRGSDGMVAFDGSHKPVEIPIHGSDEVADVTGAGDTVIATFTAALAAGADTVTAARLANLAGGIVVMKHGTATVSPAELLQAIDESFGNGKVHKTAKSKRKTRG